MKTTASKLKQKYERKLQKAISKSGGISLIHGGQEISAVIISEPKGLYAVDNFDLDIIVIEAIMQEVSTGKVFAFNQEFGSMEFTFDFIGDEISCLKYKLQVKENLSQEVAEFHLRMEA